MPGLSGGLWELVPRAGIEPGPPALGAQSLSSWTTREVPSFLILKGSKSAEKKGKKNPQKKTPDILLYFLETQSLFLGLPSWLSGK